MQFVLVALLPISFYKTKKEDKKSALHFYKAHGYSASLMGYDHTYWVKQDDNIIGSVIFSYLDNKNTCALLHALYIAPSYRLKNLALCLINFAASEHRDVICFADLSLDAFYRKLNFVEISPNAIPECMKNNFSSYQLKNNDLKAYKRINQSDLYIFKTKKTLTL